MVGSSTPLPRAHCGYCQWTSLGVDASWLRERCSDLVRLAENFKALHGFPPRPTRLLALAQGESDQAGGQPAEEVPASGPEAKKTRLGAPESPPPPSVESAGSEDGAKQGGAGADAENARARAESAGNTGGAERGHDGVEAEKDEGVKEDDVGVKEEEGDYVGEEEEDVYTALDRSLRAAGAARTRMALAVQEDNMVAANLANNDIEQVKLHIKQLRVCQVCWLARPSGACQKAGPETWYGAPPRMNNNGVNTIRCGLCRGTPVPATDGERVEAATQSLHSRAHHILRLVVDALLREAGPNPDKAHKKNVRALTKLMTHFRKSQWVKWFKVPLDAQHATGMAFRALERFRVEAALEGAADAMRQALVAFGAM